MRSARGAHEALRKERASRKITITNRKNLSNLSNREHSNRREQLNLLSRVVCGDRRDFSRGRVGFVSQTKAISFRFFTTQNGTHLSEPPRTPWFSPRAEQ